ncbi:hypothetical protein KP509_16G068300 [Ceratopteris richardii]|uniref:Uncharacterized protein n=1 Tax=Ceratopteris richardii TaxID=49495 RepID=A0A8T2T0G0_CERRI|nr:hypothetical protein KP509_16G068300 [Ceratopteris richardii]
MSASEQTGGESSSHAVVTEHPLATYEWLTSRVLSLIDDAREVGRLAVQKSLPQLDHLTAIFSNAIHQPLLHLSKRDLHLKLCSSVLSDDDLKRFWIDPASGEGCYMISARALSICWGENPTNWRWTPWPGAM